MHGLLLPLSNDVKQGWNLKIAAHLSVTVTAIVVLASLTVELDPTHDIIHTTDAATNKVRQ